MICSPCYDAGVIPKCIENLAVAATNIANGSEVTIYVQNLATEKITPYEGFVASGKVFGSVPFNFPVNVILNLWVTDLEDQVNNEATLTIAGVDYTCIAFTASNLSELNYDLSL